MGSEAEISFIILDGYNIIGTSHRDLEAQREKLVQFLIKYREARGHEIVVVFDGWKAGSGAESTFVKGGVKIIYSQLGENADSVIKRIISTERREWIVVSSDRDIASHAWAAGSIPISSDDFQQCAWRISGGGNELSELEDSGDDQELSIYAKGNPHRPSKKDKAVQRALSKL